MRDAARAVTAGILCAAGIAYSFSYDWTRHLIFAASSADAALILLCAIPLAMFGYLLPLLNPFLWLQRQLIQKRFVANSVLGASMGLFFGFCGWYVNDYPVVALAAVVFGASYIVSTSLLAQRKDRNGAS